jgi:hypothetical protein
MLRILLCVTFFIGMVAAGLSSAVMKPDNYGKIAFISDRGGKNRFLLWILMGAA